MVTVDELLAHGREKLAAAVFRPPRREAGLLLCHLLGCGEAKLLSHGELEVPGHLATRFGELLSRRLSGEPVAYLLGEREFYGRTFVVDSRVLIPRPETEHLIEEALAVVQAGAPQILDIGTGSGCVGVTLACELPDATVVALDDSLAATAVARLNAVRNAVADRVRVACSDLASALRLGPFDLVVSNPPYVDPADRDAISKEITDFEPTAAVFAPDSGASLINRLLDELAVLSPGTPFCFEMGADQEALVRDRIRTSAFELERVQTDLAGRPRVVVTRRSG